MNASKTIVLAGLAVGGLLLLRRATAAPAVAGPSTKRTADYFSPVDLAASLARLVVGVTKGVATTAPAGIAATTGPTVPGAAPSILTGGAIDWNAAQWGLGNLPGLGDPSGSWSAPSSSRVIDPSISRYSSAVDTIVAGPVYDPAAFQNNPSPYEGIAAGQW